MTLTPLRKSYVLSDVKLTCPLYWIAEPMMPLLVTYIFIQYPSSYIHFHLSSISTCSQVILITLFDYSTKCISLQHATHLEALLEENQSLSSNDLHDSNVRTLCICEPLPVDLDKVCNEQNSSLTDHVPVQWHDVFASWSVIPCFLKVAFP